MFRETPQHKATCPIDPVSKAAFDSHPARYLNASSLVDMPVNSQMRSVLQQPDAQRIRKQMLMTPDMFGGDLHIETIADAGDMENGLLMRVTKLKSGTYVGAMKTWLFEFFDAMKPDTAYWIRFSSGDAMFLSFLIADAYLHETGTFVRVEATGLGTKHTLFFGKTENLRPYEGDKVFRAREALQKSQKKKEEILKRIDEPVRMGPKASRAYHDLSIGGSVYMPPEDFTTVVSLRSIAYSFGKRKGMKFKISATEMGGATVTRIE